MSTTRHVDIANGAAANAAVVNTPLGTLDQAIANMNYDVKAAYSAVGNGIADDTIPIKNAIAAAAASTTGGGDVYFPPGRYKVTSVLIIPTGVRLIGAGGSNRWGQNASTYPVRIEYNGTVACIAIQLPGINQAVRNVKVMNIHFDGTNSTGAVDGLLLDATNGTTGGIQGIVFEDCMWSNFPRSQTYQPLTTGSAYVWGITFTRCSWHDRDRTTTGNLIQLDGPQSNVAEFTFDDPGIYPFTAAEWGVKATCVDTRFVSGTVAPSGANGLWLIGGSSVFGTHLEGANTSPIGARLVGGSHVFLPATCVTFSSHGVEVGDPTNLALGASGIIIGGGIATNTVNDVYIAASASITRVVILPMNTAINFNDQNAAINGLYVVTRLDTQQFVGPPGTATNPLLKSTAWPSTGIHVDTPTGDLCLDTGAAIKARIVAANGGLLSTKTKQSPAFNAAPAPDATLGEIYEMAALTGAVNVANPVNAVQGAKLRFFWKQDGTGGRAVAYTGTNWRSVGIAAQVTTLNTYTIDEAICIDGTIWRVVRLVTGQTV